MPCYPVSLDGYYHTPVLTRISSKRKITGDSSETRSDGPDAGRQFTQLGFKLSDIEAWSGLPDTGQHPYKWPNIHQPFQVSEKRREINEYGFDGVGVQGADTVWPDMPSESAKQVCSVDVDIHCAPYSS
jgi:hypothetical protein